MPPFEPHARRAARVPLHRRRHHDHAQACDALRRALQAGPHLGPQGPVHRGVPVGAMTKTLSERDITANHEHDPRLYLGRTSAGTLRFEDSPTELRYEVDLPDTSAGRDVANLARAGRPQGVIARVPHRSKSEVVRRPRHRPRASFCRRSDGRPHRDHLLSRLTGTARSSWRCAPSPPTSTPTSNDLVEAANRGELPDLIVPLGRKPPSE
jgi:hypothetical protein